MKKILLVLLLFTIITVDAKAEYYDTITETVYSITDTIQINQTVNAEIIYQENYFLDSSVSMSILFSGYNFTPYNYSIYVNGSLLLDTAVIDTDIVTKSFEILENQENIIVVYVSYDDNIYTSTTVSYYYITSSNYSITDTITITGITPIFDLTVENTDFKRWKKLSEIYPDLSSIKSDWQKWCIVAAGETDNYYKESKINYLKFQRLADKYK
jgi:hypothetical protein